MPRSHGERVSGNRKSGFVVAAVSKGSDDRRPDTNSSLVDRRRVSIVRHASMAFGHTREQRAQTDERRAPTTNDSSDLRTTHVNAELRMRNARVRPPSSLLLAPALVVRNSAF